MRLNLRRVIDFQGDGLLIPGLFPGIACPAEYCFHASIRFSFKAAVIDPELQVTLQRRDRPDLV
jgi:hypothetical protein